MKGDQPFVTDEGNFILDLHLKRIGNPRQLSLVLNQIPGVVENGLFIDICDVVIVGYGDGRVRPATSPITRLTRSGSIYWMTTISFRYGGLDPDPWNSNAPSASISLPSCRF